MAEDRDFIVFDELRDAVPGEPKKVRDLSAWLSRVAVQVGAPVVLLGFPLPNAFPKPGRPNRDR